MYFYHESFVIIVLTVVLEILFIHQIHIALRYPSNVRYFNDTDDVAVLWVPVAASVALVGMIAIV